MGQLNRPRRQRIEADFERISQLEPGLHLHEQAGTLSIVGAIHITQEGSGHIDKIEVEICFLPDYPKHEPKIRETAARFTPDGVRHINRDDGTFCLWIPEESKWRGKDPDSIITWFNEVVVFIHRQLTYEVLREWTGPQRRHGDDGRIDYLMETTACDEATARYAMQLASNGVASIQRLSACPCGSGMTWEKCHRRAAILTMSHIRKR